MKHLVIIFLLATTSVGAQLYPDSKGRDFWLTFMPNFHNNADQLSKDVLRQREHQLYLEIGADKPTTGTIYLRDKDYNVRVVPFQITDPTKIFEFKTFYEPYELMGFNNGGVLNSDAFNQNELSAPQYVHIESTEDITVYALNQAELTSEAFLVLPTDALAEDYVVMSYTSDAKLGGGLGGSELSGASTPSQFAVVATEDSTTVTVVTSAPTFKHPVPGSFSVLLRKGESYLVQADPEVAEFADLTGTTVRADHPVAVFGGHQRATLPIEDNDSLSSRDCIIEQMSPVRTWGKRAFLAPFALPSDEIGIGTDLFRVVAGFDSTKVVVDADTVRMLMKGQYYEGSLTQPLVVRTTRPALIAAFKKSSSPSSTTGTANNFGDPFMMVIPPTEQFMDSYRFVNVQSYMYKGSVNFPILDDSVYKEQWLNIVIPTSRTGNVFLDGQKINPARFRVFPDPEYSYAVIAMGGGVHAIKADTNFGIYVYGYGKANSYGYVGGMAFRPLDVNPPQFGGAPGCFDVTGVVSDSILGDTRLKYVRLIPTTDKNARITFQNTTFPASVARFTISLINIYADGAAAVEAEDYAEQRSQTSVQLAGFTLGLREVGSANIVPGKSWVTPVGRGRCDTVTIVNYGAYAHTIDSLSFGLHTVNIVGGSLPVKVAPGDSVRIAYCATYTVPGLAVDTLFIGDQCTTRPILQRTVTVKLDQDPPSITSDMDACSSHVNVRVTELADSDFGLDTVAIDYPGLRNCTVVVKDSTPSVFSFDLSIVDPYQDAIWSIVAVDSAGNRSIRKDTIPGFTLEFSSGGTTSPEIDFGDVGLGLLNCLNVQIRNTGIYSIDIPKAYVRGNLRFSIPPSQLPITVAPKAVVTLVVCFEPVAADTTPVRDTVVLLRGCVERELPLRGVGTAQVYEGISRCATPIGTSVVSVPATMPLHTSPLPASTTVTVVLAQPTEACTVRLINSVGAEAAFYTWSGTATQAVEIVVDKLIDGAYTCVVSSQGRVQTGRILVKH